MVGSLGLSKLGFAWIRSILLDLARVGSVWFRLAWVCWLTQAGWLDLALAHSGFLGLALVNLG